GRHAAGGAADRLAEAARGGGCGGAVQEDEVLERLARGQRVADLDVAGRVGADVAVVERVGDVAARLRGRRPGLGHLHVGARGDDGGAGGAAVVCGVGVERGGGFGGGVVEDGAVAGGGVDRDGDRDLDVGAGRHAAGRAADRLPEAAGAGRCAGVDEGGVLERLARGQGVSDVDVAGRVGAIVGGVG